MSQDTILILSKHELTVIKVIFGIIIVSSYGCAVEAITIVIAVVIDVNVKVLSKYVIEETFKRKNIKNSIYTFSKLH